MAASREPAVVFMSGGGRREAAPRVHVQPRSASASVCPALVRHLGSICAIYVSQISHFFPVFFGVTVSPRRRSAVGERLRDSSDSTGRNLAAIGGESARSVGGCGVPTAARHVDGSRRMLGQQTDIKRQVAFMRSHNLYIKQAASNSARLNL